jgi:two-component system, OmpR family, phosphate regulon sensor histidine kinase PhoR
LNILKTTYFWRNYLIYLVLLLLATGVTGFLQAINIGRIETREDAAQLEGQMSLLSKAGIAPLISSDIGLLRELAVNVADNSGLRVTLIAADGTVLVDTMEDAAAMQNHLLRPEIQMALTRGRGEVERYSNTVNKNFVYRALPVQREGELLGFVRVARAREDLDVAISELHMQVAGDALLVFFILGALAFLLVRRSASTVELLTETTVAIAQGDFDRRVPEARALGMKRLGDAINQMARSSAGRVSDLTADRNRLATIFAGMVEGVIDVDERQHIVHINDAAVVLLGLEAGKSRGKPVWQEIREQKITLALDEAVRTRSVIRTQVDYLRNRDQLVIDLYVASLADDDNKPIGAILVLHDVTELRHLERIRTDFVANASHELKTPITAIRGLSETVVGDPDVERETLLHFMQRIHAQSIRLSQLVGDLMTISRLEADHGKDSFSRINFGDLAARAVTTATGAAEFKHQQLGSRLPSERLEVYGDRQNLSQLVDNLIDNAIKYTPERGHIEVRLSRWGDELLLEVEDSGIGISPQFQERVFERFYRVDKARSQSLGGTGLGLSIVRNIAERHGGSVAVKSQLGRGSVFSFRMPLAASGNGA